MLFARRGLFLRLLKPFRNVVFIGLVVADAASRFTQLLICATKWISSNNVYSGTDGALDMKLRCQATFHRGWRPFPVTRRRLTRVLKLSRNKERENKISGGKTVAEELNRGARGCLGEFHNGAENPFNALVRQMIVAEINLRNHHQRGFQPLSGGWRTACTW
jgi:hypothetical protein